MMSKIKNKLFTPKHTYLEDGLPNGWVFKFNKPTYPDYVSVPMESGKTGMYKLKEIHTPYDPGDMHIPRWEFIKYVKRSDDDIT